MLTTKVATDGGSCRHSDPTVCRLLALVSDRSHVISPVAATYHFHSRGRIEIHDLLCSICVVSFDSQISQPDFFNYVDSLKVGSESYFWSSHAGPPSESLFAMTNPTHLLVDRVGTVIRVWPGSHQDKSVRDRMAKQILSDTSVVVDTISALPSREPRNPQDARLRH